MGSGKELGGGGESVIRLHYVRKKLFSIKGKKLFGQYLDKEGPATCCPLGMTQMAE